MLSREVLGVELAEAGAGAVVVVVVVVVVVAGAEAAVAGAVAGALSGGGVSRPEGGFDGAIEFWASAPGVSTASSAIRTGAATSTARQVRKRFMLKLEAFELRMIMS